MIRKPLVLDLNSRKANLPAGDHLSSESVADLQEAQLAQAKALIGTQTEIVEHQAWTYEDSANVSYGAETVKAKLDSLDLLKAPKASPVFTGVSRFGTDTDYVEILADGTVILNGEATAYDDLLSEMRQSLKGANDKPDWDATDFALLFPRNDTAEYITFNKQLPHRWKEGTTIFPHVHFYQDQNLSPVFKMDYRWTNIGEAVSASWTTYVIDEIVGNQTWSSGMLHRIVHGAGSPGISGVGKTLSSLLQIKLYRDDNTYVGDCKVVSFDLHYQIDSFGSSLEYTK